MSEIAIDAVQYLDRVRRLADLIREEQDLLLVDRNIGGRLLPGESYFPIEPCLASVQVKSTLTRTQIRDATVNCISIKRLFGWPLVHEDQSDRETRATRVRQAVLRRFLLRQPFGAG